MANEIGSAREDGKVKIFVENDPFVVQTTSTILQKVEYLLKVPDCLESIISQYSYLLAIDLKRFKHDYKVSDYPVEKYKSELELN